MFGRLAAPRRVALYSSAVISGFATMALEMLIGRTLTPYFGGTIYTWGALISVFLAGMSTGYASAGRIADRRPNLGIIAGLFLLMGLYMAVPSLLGDTILNSILDRTDDVRIGAAGQAPVRFIGGVSTDHSGFGVGRILDVDVVGERLLALHEDREMPVIPGYEVNSYTLQAHQAEAAR